MSGLRALIDRNHCEFTITRQAELLGLSRASVYAQPSPPTAADLVLWQSLDAEYTKHPFYGQRRLQWALKEHYDITVGRCAIRTAMAHLGLETLYQKRKTTFRNQAHRIYPYLLRHVPITHPNHVWSVDITLHPAATWFLLPRCHY